MFESVLKKAMVRHRTGCMGVGEPVDGARQG